MDSTIYDGRRSEDCRPEDDSLTSVNCKEPQGPLEAGKLAFIKEAMMVRDLSPLFFLTLHSQLLIGQRRNSALVVKMLCLLQIRLVGCLSKPTWRRWQSPHRGAMLLLLHGEVTFNHHTTCQMLTLSRHQFRWCWPCRFSTWSNCRRSALPIEERGGGPKQCWAIRWW